MLGDGVAARDLIADAEVIVSELVTNAVNARCTSTQLMLTTQDDVVRIEVHDDAAGTPVLRRPSSTDEHGRGLLIVSRVAKDWGVDAGKRGKSVSAELDLAGVSV